MHILKVQRITSVMSNVFFCKMKVEDKNRLLAGEITDGDSAEHNGQRNARCIFTLGLLVGVCINLFIIVLLLWGGPSPYGTVTVTSSDHPEVTFSFRDIEEYDHPLRHHKTRIQTNESVSNQRPSFRQYDERLRHHNTRVEVHEERADESASNQEGSYKTAERHHGKQISRNQTRALSCSAQESNRFDCWPEFVPASQQKCEARGCCWRPAADKVPFCYYPDGYVSYAVTSFSSSAQGMTTRLTRKRASPYPHDVIDLQVDVIYLSENTVRFRIFDPNKKRYEVPMNLTTSSKTVHAEDTDYNVTFQSSPFGIRISRKSNGATLFDSCNMAPLVFADQFLQIGTRLSSPNIYGLGQRNGPLRIDVNWTQHIMWNKGANPDGGGNLYGAHPFYLNLEPEGNAHGVFLFSSNALELALQPYAGGEGGVTYRSMGGILDFFVFTGPSPVQVVEQYVSLIGRPAMPAFWSLGFHLCKYGYFSTTNLTAVINRNRAAKIPYDVQWSDIDYMQAYKDWTYDANGSYAGLNLLVDDLHKHNQRYVMIIDPGISSTQKPGSYPPYDEGVQMDVFIKNATGQILVGKVWPGLTAFPDFFHPSADQYWFNQMKRYHDQISFDGIWLDMNEIANFVDGSTHGCTNGPLDKPPYIPPKISGKTMYSRTVCPSAKQALSTYYNLHNMYGWSEMRSTKAGLTKLLGKRSFILSRSTFVGSGRYGAHWSGDIKSAWSDLYYTIPSILNFNMFGVPFAGADICGFLKDTSRELCIRWMQLGAFYPFMRNHDAINAKPQDPASFDTEAVDYMRTALEVRYSLLPFMYTWFFLSHTTGTPVIRPLFMLFPKTETIDKQFMWGDSLLVSPVLQARATKVKAYFPAGRWYDLYHGLLLPTVGEEWLVLDAPLSTINAHIRGGSIIPLLPPAVTTNEMRNKPFELVVAPDAQSSAHGLLYWDDGESLDSIEMNKYSVVNFTLNKTTLRSTVTSGGYPDMILDRVVVFGVASAPKRVTLNGKSNVAFSFGASSKVLYILELDIDLLVPFNLTWTL